MDVNHPIRLVSVPIRQGIHGWAVWIGRRNRVVIIMLGLTDKDGIHWDSCATFIGPLKRTSQTKTRANTRGDVINERWFEL
jgi:hypothetical protein